MNRKLGIFVSSTYKDLIHERNAVSRAILASGNIPMGMELFTPNGMAAVDIIKSSIDNCDYLLLIIAGMYGSTLIENGVQKSYTEMEYDYAVEMDKPVLLFFCENIDSLPASKVESSPKKRKLLNKFLDKVKNTNGLLGKSWIDIKDLELKASQALGKLNLHADTSLGWVRVKEAVTIPENTDAMFFFTQEHRPKSSLFTTLAENTSEIVICLKTGVTLFSSYEKQLLHEIDSGCKLSFITSKKEYLFSVESQQDLDIYELNMDKVKYHLSRIKNTTVFPDNLEVETVGKLLTMGILYFRKKDGTEYLLMQEYFISSRVGRDRPMFLQKKGDPWYDAYYEELMHLKSISEACEICDL